MMDETSGTAAMIAHWKALRAQQQLAAAASMTLGSPILSAQVVVGAQHVQLQGVAATVAMSALTATVIQPPELLIGIDLVLRGERTDEGVIIQAVSPVWRRFLDELAGNPEAFWKLDPWQTEDLIAGAWRHYDFQVTLTPRSGDKGRDIIAYRDDIGAIRFLDQVKRYKAGHLVDANEVRAMVGVLNLDAKASKAYVTTTSAFAPGVQDEFAALMPTRLELRDGIQLREWLTRSIKK
jgi:restriction system protein